MQLRLDRLTGLRIELSPGWYELPSHLDQNDRLRLQRLLADGLDCAVVLESDWDELPALRGADLSATLLHLTVPAQIPPDQRALALQALRPRLGLFTAEGGPRWPDRAWDELDVKSAVASWLRRSLRAPTHPLAHLGLPHLPLDDLFAATAEPIELLHLVEATIARVAWQRRDSQATDWRSAITWSVGRRLVARLFGAPPALRPKLAQAILDAPDGALPHNLAPALRDQLARLGLALVHSGDAALLPLARAAAEARPTALLALAQSTVSGRDLRLHAHVAFLLSAIDDFASTFGQHFVVDLRPLVRRVARFTERLYRALRGREGARIVVLMRHGSGANTTVTTHLDEARREGLWSVTAEIPTPLLSSDTVTFADILLACSLALLEWTLGDVNLPLPTLTALHQTLERALAAAPATPEPTLGDDADTFTVTLAALHSLRAALDRDRDPAAAARLHAVTPHLLLQLTQLVQATQDGLAAHGARLCLRITGLERIADPARIDALVLSRAADLARIPATILLGLPLAAEYAATAAQRVSDVFLALTYPEIAATDDEQAKEALAITRALLEHRADLTQLFGEDHVDARLDQLADACGGIPRDTLAVAMAAAERATGPTITALDIAAAARARMARLAAATAPITADQLQALDTLHALPSAADLHSGRLLARDGGGWALHPLLHLSPAPRPPHP